MSKCFESDGMNHEVNLCACLGPVNGEPLCPCKMRQTGLNPDSGKWTVDEQLKFAKALKKVFDMETTLQEDELPGSY